MKTQPTKLVLGSLCAFALAVAAQAGSLTNNFTSVFDYVANGIVGDTNWDGVYLGFGDIPGGNAGGNGNGVSVAADTTLQSPPIGFLRVQTTGSDWSGAGDDGFYAWKLVSGDFDVSVQSVPPWQNQGNNFAGLMVRAWNTNQSGAPVSFTSTNASENWLAVFRAQQFGIGEIRQATNGANVENTFPENSTDTNSSRYYRITRIGDTFTFYIKTNATDSWFLITNASAGGGYVAAMGSVTRPDWHGQPVQVGIAQAIFAVPGPPAIDYFTDFELSGANVTSPASLPAAPDSLVTSAPNTNGSLTLSWNTNGGTGSIVILRKLAPANTVLVANPVQGLTYTANTNFNNPATLIAGNTHVVYAGSATNVTVTGLGGSNNLYAAEVLSYDGSGPSIVYNTAAPATTNFLGTGVPAGLIVNIFPTNLPVGGAGQVQVIAIFSTGEQVDVTTDPSVILGSSDTTVVSISGGVLNALQAGTSTISAGYAGFSGGAGVTVAAPRFADNFAVSQDYLANGLPGSTWDGIYEREGDLPNGDNGGDNMFATAVDANVSSNNTLTVSAGGTTWEGPSDDGFFLFKYMPGDFQAMVHVDLTAHGAYQFAGLLVRAANADGSPFQGSENYVANWFFDDYGVITSDRATVNGVYQGANDNTGTTPVNLQWLLIQRVNGTNFYCYSKLNATDPWTLNRLLVQPTLSNGVPVQVGLAQTTYTAGPSETVRFDSFALDGNGLVSSPPTTPPAAPTNFVMTLNPDVTMTLKWTVPGTNADGSAYRSLVVMRAGLPVSAQPYLAVGLGGDVQNPVNPFGVADDNLGSGNYVVYRTPFGATNLQQEVTVTGLSPGVTYYAAVFTFVGLGGARTFNTSSQATAENPAFSNLIDGVLIGLQSRLAQNGIPLGGVGIPIVDGVFTGGGLADITPAVTVLSDNTNIILTTNSILTGLALGSATVHISYGGFTNVLSVTVRNPSFTDNFLTPHDYLANGVTNAPWDGVYLKPGDIPDQTFTDDPATATLGAFAGGGMLNVTNLYGGFEFNQDDGFFLFKYVPTDFQIAVDLADFTNNGTQNYNNSGLLVRGYTVATNGLLGAPMDESGNECWISWVRFDEFGNGTRYERTIDNGTQRPFNPDVNSLEHWMLLARVNDTNFYFFLRQDTNSAWHTTGIGNLTGPTALAKFAGQPMQAGLVLSGFGGNGGGGVVCNVGFANFLLDIGSPALNIANTGTNVMVRWPASPSAQLQSTPSLSAPNWQPVPGTPAFINGQYNLPVPSGTNAFFRLRD